MKLLDQIKGALGISLRPQPRNYARQRGISAGPITIVTGGAANYFDGLNVSADRTPVPQLSESSRSFMVSSGRRRLASIASHLYDNVGVVGYTVDKFADYCVPILPQATTDDDTWNKEAEFLFQGWAARAEFSGRFDLGQVQRIHSRTLLADGESFTIAVEDAEDVRLMLVGSDQVKSPDKANKFCVDGVQLSASGQLVGYHVFSPDDKSSQLVEASHAFHMFDPFRALDYRGCSALRRGLNDARDIGDIKGLEKLNQKIRASLPAVIEGDIPIDPERWGDEEENAPAGDAPAHEKKLALADLLGGDIPALPTGQKLNVLSNNRDPAPVTEFITALSAHFIFGTGLPPAFILDEKLTGPNIRAVNGKAQRTFDAHKAHHERFLRWCWIRVIGAAIANGKLPARPGWDTITVQSQAVLTIDTGDDASADREDLKLGFRTRQDISGKRGADWQKIETQLTREHAFILEECKALQAAHPEIPLAFWLKARGFDVGPIVEIIKAEKGYKEPRKEDDK